MIPRSCILFWEEPNRDCDQVQAHQDHSGLWTTGINLSASFWWTAITPATLFIQAVLVACHCCPTDNTIITSPVQRLWGCHQSTISGQRRLRIIIFVYCIQLNTSAYLSLSRGRGQQINANEQLLIIIFLSVIINGPQRVPGFRDEIVRAVFCFVRQKT